MLDDELADRGVPIFSRPFEAAKVWAERAGNLMLALEHERWFQDAYSKIHPSVDFSADSFLTLAASARGISYYLKPPMAYGRVAIQPINYVAISEGELGQLYRRHVNSFWELHWQACDGVDLFMALVNFHPAGTAAQNMIITAVNQLTASSRQLIASEIDSSLPQGVAMAAELAGKAVLASMGSTDKQLRTLGHDVPAIVSAVSADLPSPCDTLVAAAAARLPPYVQVRYDAPILSIVEGQHIFADALFVTADLLRRTNHDQIYWRAAMADDIPARAFNQL